MEENKGDVTFVVHRDWIVALSKLSVEMQDQVIGDLIRYGTELPLEHEDDPIINTFVAQKIKDINFSKQKYQEKIDKGKKGGENNKKFKDEDIYIIAHDLCLNRSSEKVSNIAETVAKQLGCSVSTVTHSIGWLQRDSDVFDPNFKKGQVNKSQIKVEDGDFDFELKDRDYKIVEEKQTNVYKPRQKQVYIPVAK